MAELLTDKLTTIPDTKKAPGDTQAAAATAAADPLANYEDMELISKRIDTRLTVDRYARQAFEAEWFKTILYFIGEQAVIRDRTGRFRRRKLPRNWPRVTTNKVAEKVNDFVSTLMRGRVPIGYFPESGDPADVAVAEMETTLRNVIYEETGVEMNEAIQAALVATTGNAFRVTYYDNSPEHGVIPIQQSQCTACQAIVTPAQAASKVCPTCKEQGDIFQKAVGPDGQPVTENLPIGKLCADVVSPFEMRLDHTIPDFADHRWYCRLHLYDKDFAKVNWKEYADDIAKLEQAEPGSEESLTIFYLSALSRLTSTFLGGAAGGGSASSFKESPKVLAYEFCELPTIEFPNGLHVVRLGGSPKLIVDKGPLPYRVSAGIRKGKPFLNVAHFGGEVVPGRLWRKTRVTDIIPLQNFRNVIDAAIKMTILRAAGPSWLNPIGSNVTKFSGEPVQVIDYTPVVLGGTAFAKPEMIEPALQSINVLVAVANKIDDAIERVAGTFFLQGGDAPPNISAASALALLDERAQRAISPLIREWAKGYKIWEGQAIEILRANAVDERMYAVAGQNKKWEFHKFSNADLAGAVTVRVDYEGVVPRSQATTRATIIQLTQMGFIQPLDPQENQNVLAEFGLSRLRGSADKDWSDAAKEYRMFFDDDEPPMVLPLVQNSAVHLQQHADDAKTDEFRQLRKQNPQKAQQWLDHIQATVVDMQASAQMHAGMAAQAAGKDPNAPGPNQSGAQAGAQAGNRQPLGPTADIAAPPEAVPPGEHPGVNLPHPPAAPTGR